MTIKDLPRHLFNVITFPSQVSKQLHVTVLPEWLIHRKDMKTHQKWVALRSSSVFQYGIDANVVIPGSRRSGRIKRTGEVNKQAI